MGSIGLDFGTTYSAIAGITTMKDGILVPEGIHLSDEDKSFFHDSLALKEEGRPLLYGRTARSRIFYSGATVYQGFKLMLAEKNPEMLAKYGYKDISPADVVKGYVNDLLTKYRTVTGTLEEPIEKLVIGVPEIWVEDINKKQCFQELESVVSSLGYIKDVHLVSEPTCACVYYVSKYQAQHNGEPFEGNILVIDYGGGTLDIALCRVTNEDDRPKVTPLCRAGAGANEDGQLGKAGLEFMSMAVRLALLDAGITQEELDARQTDGDFCQCVYDLEEAFKEFGTRSDKNDEVKDFKETFEDLRLEDAFENDTVFFKVKFSQRVIYNGESLYRPVDGFVTYGVIARAFRKVIKPALDAGLNTIIQYMNDNHLEYGFHSDHFKIQLIGGFCNFYLVERAIRKRLGIAVDEDEDNRYIDELKKGDDRTLAVAYGAALLANEQSDYGVVSQYSLGLSSPQMGTFWAIKKGNEVDVNRLYLFKAPSGSALLFRASEIKEFVFSDNDSERNLLLGSKFSNQLKMNKNKTYIFALSQSRAKILSFHYWEVCQIEEVKPFLKDLEERITAGEDIPGLGIEHIVLLTTVDQL